MTHADGSPPAWVRPAAAQGGPAVHPRPGPVRGRRPPARHAPRGGAAQPAPARADPVRRHPRGRGPPEGQGRHHRGDAGLAQPGLDAHAVRRHAGRARHRQGAVPGPGGGVRRRRGPLLRAGRARADRRGLRAAARGGRRAPRAGRRRPAHPRRPAGAHHEPHLRLGGRRRPGDRGGVPRRRGDGRAGHALPAGPPRAARDVRRGRGLRPGDRQADHLGDHPGPARPPDPVRHGVRRARAQDQGDLAGHRRRVRQQGPHLPRLPVRDRRLDDHRASR